MVSANSPSLDQQLQLAAQYHQKGQAQKAEKQYKALIKKRFDLARTHNLLGILYLQSEQYKKASDHLSKAIGAGNSDPDCLYNKGICELEVEKFEEASRSFLACIEQKQDHSLAWFNLGISFSRSEHLEKALEAFSKDYEIHKRTESLREISSILLHKKQYSEAEEYAKAALQQIPDDKQALYNLCRAMLCQLETMETPSIEIAEHTLKLGQLLIKLNPNSEQGFSVCADALQQIGEVDLALKHYKKAVEKDPTNAKIHANIGMIELSKGNFQSGWEGIGWREKYGQELYGMDAKSFNLCRAPIWQGQVESGKHLLVSSEQGIGDQIIQAQLVKELLEKGMLVTMTCNPKMKSLFQRSLPQANIISNEETPKVSQLNTINYKIKMLELCRHLRPSFDHFKPQDSYLKADPALVQHFKEKYKVFDNKLKIGISWKSNSVSCGDRKTTDISHWFSLLNLPNIQFFSVQYGEVNEDIERALNHTGQTIYVDDEFNPFDDIEKATAQIAAMDLVITISNAAAHLAGAIGTPCWVMLPTMPLWHWFRDRSDSLWYKSVHLYRQPQLTGWAPVVESIKKNLIEYEK